MSRVVRRVGGDPGAHLVVLDTDSTGTSARVTTVDAYVPGRAVEDYDPEDVAQLGLDGLEEVEQVKTLWAIFTNEEEGHSTRISGWMPKEEAECELTGLLENGESCAYIVPKDT